MPPFVSGRSEHQQSSLSLTTMRRAPPSFIAMPAPRRINTLQVFTFRWHHSAASKVVLTGSFDGWSESIVVPRDPHCHDEFAVSIALDRLVRHEFKFVVDGTWRCSHAFPTAYDENGFVNNIIEAVDPEVLAKAVFAGGAAVVGKRRAGADFFVAGRSLAGSSWSPKKSRVVC